MQGLINMFFDYRNDELFNFQLGCVAGVAAVLFFFLVFLVLKFIYDIWFRYPRRTGGIKIKGERGDLFISSSAVSDLLKSLQSEFRFIEVNKVQLLQGKQSYEIKLHLTLDAGSESFPEQAVELKNSAFEILRDRFGISNISKIDLKLHKISTH